MLTQRINKRQAKKFPEAVNVQISAQKRVPYRGPTGCEHLASSNVKMLIAPSHIIAMLVIESRKALHLSVSVGADTSDVIITEYDMIERLNGRPITIAFNEPIPHVIVLQSR
jgi:hypothetical protein